jgi:hypothetical protein
MQLHLQLCIFIYLYKLKFKMKCYIFDCRRQATDKSSKLMHYILIVIRSRDSSAAIVTAYEQKGRSSSPGRVKNF